MKRIPKSWVFTSFGLLLVPGLCVAQGVKSEAMMLNDSLPHASQQVRVKPSGPRPLPVEPSGQPLDFAERYAMEEDLKNRVTTRWHSRGGRADDTAKVLVEPRLSASPKTKMPSRTLMDLQAEGDKRKTDLWTVTVPRPFPVEPNE